MKFIQAAMLLAILASGCSTPEHQSAPLPSPLKSQGTWLYTDARSAVERKSVLELEAYRTLVSLADDALKPSAPAVFDEAIQVAALPARSSLQLLAFRVHIHLPPSKTTYEVYKTMNLPDGPPDAKGLMGAISKSLAQSPSGAALVVCEVEVEVNGKSYRSIVRESYKANLSLTNFVAHMKQAAVEALREVEARP